MRRLFYLIVLLIASQMLSFAQGWSYVEGLFPSSGNENIEPSVTINHVQDLNGNKLIVGSFYNRLEYKGHKVMSVGVGIFVMKMDSYGDVISLRSHSLGGTTADLKNTRIIFDENENLFFVVTVKSKTQTEFGYYNSTDSDHVVIIKFNKNLEFQWANKIIDGKEVYVSGITIGDDNRLYIIGRGGINDEEVSLKNYYPECSTASGNLDPVSFNPKLNNIITHIDNKYNYNIDTIRKYYIKNPNNHDLKNILACTANTIDLFNIDTLNKYKDFFNSTYKNIAQNRINRIKCINSLSIDSKLKESYTKKNTKPGTTVNVGDYTFNSSIHYVYIVASVNSVDGVVEWANGFPSLPNTVIKASDVYVRSVATTTQQFDDLLYFDGALFVVGSHEGLIIDGKKYFALQSYTVNGDLSVSGGLSPDLIMLRLSASNGKVEWVQTGGGRGADRYIKILREDNFLKVIGRVDPHKDSEYNKYKSGKMSKEGIMLDSMVNMQPDTIKTWANRKQSSRFGCNSVSGVLYAKYNTEGRLISKSFSPGLNLPDELINGSGYIVTATAIESGNNIEEKITFNTDTIIVAPQSAGKIVICVYDDDGVPVRALSYEDSLCNMIDIKMSIDDNNKRLTVAGRSFSDKVTFDMVGNQKKFIKNRGYHDITYYESDAYMQNYRNTYKKKESEGFYNYHAANSGYIAQIDLDFSIAFTEIDHAKCYGDKNGKLKVGTFFKIDDKCTYKWKKIDDENYEFSYEKDEKGNIDSSVVYMLPAGKYSVTVRNGDVERVLTQEILQPEKIELNGIVTDTKWCEDTGEILLNVTGGTGNYTYFWHQGNTSALIQASQTNSPHLNQLGKGKYQVKVTDANGCSMPAEFEVKNLSEKINIENSQLTWDYSTHTLTFKPTENDKISECKWYNGIKNGSFNKISSNPYIFEAKNLDAGQYTIEITTTDCCPQTITEHLVNQTEFYVKAMVQKHVTCYGYTDGEISFQYSDNKNGNEYISEWKVDGNKLNPIPTQQDGIYKNLPAGLHTITFHHDGGDYQLTAMINQPKKLEVSMHSINVTCAESADGQISVDVKGGTEPYTYDWGDGNTYQTRNNLSATTPMDDAKYAYKDVYTVTVKDDNGCTANGEAIIKKPKQITAEITLYSLSCAGYNDGRLEIKNINGGNGYAYHIWSNTLMADEIHGLKDGKYNVTIYDSLGCSRRIINDKNNDDLEISRGYEININEDIVQPTCAEIADGSITITATKINSDSEKFKYRWNGSIPANIIDTLKTLPYVPSGIYELTVIDPSDNCETKKTYDLRAENKAPQVNLTLSEWEVCDGERLKIYVEKEGKGIYDYYVNDEFKAQSRGKFSESTNTYMDTLEVALNGAGEYTLSVIDYSEANDQGKQCQGKASAPLTIKYTPSAKIDDNTLAWCPGAEINLNLTVADQPKTNFVWMKGIDTLSLTQNLFIDNALGVGKYILHAESNGCHSKDSVEVARLDEEKMQLNVEPSDPNKGFLPSDTLWCYGEGHIATLEASRYDARSYLWFRNGDTLILGNGALLNSPVLMTNIPGEYYIIGKFGGCEVYSDTMKIGPRQRIELNIVKDTTIIAGEPFILDLGENPAIKSYKWTEKGSQTSLSDTHYMEWETRYAQNGDVKNFQIMVEDENGCHAIAQTKVRIRRDAVQTTGLTNASTEPLTLYPNPAHSGFYVEAPASDRTLHIYGASGQLVLEQSVNGKTWVSTAHLTAGFYLVRTETAAAKLVVE